MKIFWILGQLLFWCFFVVNSSAQVAPPVPVTNGDRPVIFLHRLDLALEKKPDVDKITLSDLLFLVDEEGKLIAKAKAEAAKAEAAKAEAAKAEAAKAEAAKAEAAKAEAAKAEAAKAEAAKAEAAKAEAAKQN